MQAPENPNLSKIWAIIHDIYLNGDKNTYIYIENMHIAYLAFSYLHQHMYFTCKK